MGICDLFFFEENSNSVYRLQNETLEMGWQSRNIKT